MTEPTADTDVAAGGSAPALPEPTLADTASPADSPVLPSLPPAAPPTAPTKTEAELFDARAMVEATRAHVANPAYGALPKVTPEGLEAQQQLRAAARRKRRRNRMVAWVVVAVFIGGIAAAGWFAYRAYRDDQDRQAAERAERAAAEAAGEDAKAGVAPGALSPLGNQQQVIEAMEDINSSDAQLSGGGLRDIVDQAQTVVDDMNDTDGDADVHLVEELLPAGAIAAARQLDDSDGFERYLVDREAWATSDSVGYVTWLQAVQAEPPAAPGAPEFALFPAVRPGQVGIAVERDGERLLRAVVVGVDPEVNVIVGDG